MHEQATRVARFAGQTRRTQMTSTRYAICALIALLPACSGSEADVVPIEYSAELLGASPAAEDAPISPQYQPCNEPAGVPCLGVGASLNGRDAFTGDALMSGRIGYEWRRDISNDAVDPSSDALLVAGMGLSSVSDLANVALHPDFGTTYQNTPIGFSYQIVGQQQQRYPITFEVPEESDPGDCNPPCYPLPPNVPIEGGSKSRGDRHVLVIDRDLWRLYETYSTHPVRRKRSFHGWRAYAGAVFDLGEGDYRPDGWTSADAAGLPIFPFLVRYDEIVEKNAIDHAVRFTLRNTRRSYITPASHFASTSCDANLPPMGMRLRLKASYVISPSLPLHVRVILAALKKYGMILADNGGNLFVSGTHDLSWNDAELAAMKQVHASDFEVVLMDRNQIVDDCP